MTEIKNSYNTKVLQHFEFIVFQHFGVISRMVQFLQLFLFLIIRKYNYIQSTLWQLHKCVFVLKESKMFSYKIIMQSLHRALCQKIHPLLNNSQHITGNIPNLSSQEIDV